MPPVLSMPDHQRQFEAHRDARADRSAKAAFRGGRVVRWAAVFALLVAACIAPASAARELVLGVLAYRPKPIMEQAWQPLVESLSDAIPDASVRLRLLDSDEMANALQRQELDFVFTNPSHFIALRGENALSGALATLVTQYQDVPTAYIGGVIITRSDRTDLRDLSSLNGKRIATPDRNFLGGYVAQAYEMLLAGIQPDMVELRTGSDVHDSVVDAVLKGEVDAGFIRTGLIEQLEREGRISRSQLRVISQQNPLGFPFVTSTRLYPEWPLVALPQVEDHIARQMAAQLLNLAPRHPAARAAGIHGFTIPADYSPVESAMRALRVAPFDTLPDFTWRDVLKRYNAWVLALTAAGIVILVLAVGLARGNRQLGAAHRRSQALAATVELERQRLGNILEATQVGTWEWNVMTGKLVVNARWAEIIGFTLEELSPITIDTWTQCLHPDDLQTSNTLLGKHFRGEIPDYRFEGRVQHKAGHWVWIFICGRLISRTPDDRPLVMVGTHQDISERKHAEELLRLSASVFTNSYEAILITDHTNRIVDVNPAFSRITGYSREEVLGQNPSMLSSGRQDREFYSAMWKSLSERDHWRGEVWNRRKNGEPYAESLSITRVKDESGRLIHHVAVFSDISRLKAHAEELDRIAHFDPLTGIPNRRLLDDRLRHAIAHADRSGRPLAVCMLDLDGFKPINDQFGHEAGDQLLVEIVQRLQAMLRAVDTVARLGGDEFVLLLGDLDSEVVFERILNEVRKPVRIQDAAVNVSASIGVALYPEDNADADTLLRHADQAMYRAKQRGRNCVQFFDASVEQDLRSQQELLKRLTQALEQRELVLHYQPKVDMLARQPIGVEALVRWQHPERGLLPPAEFLPAMEGNELEVRLGEWVIGSALEQIDAWTASGIELSVAINVSARHLLKPGFVDALRQALAAHPDVAPQQLEIEIVESTAITDMRKALDVLNACRQLGVRLALDDFGTGYASLAYFRRLPIDLLKIDRSFVRDMLSDADDRAIVLSVVHLAQAFDREVIAEGVETLDHANALINMGCRLGQGFGIARPMPAEHIPGWLNWYTSPEASQQGTVSQREATCSA